MENATSLGPDPASLEPAGLSRARKALWEILADQIEPVTIAGLVALTGLHENTVRGHLDGLAKAGLVSRERSRPDGRGRPAWLWRAVDQRPGSEYAGLAAALARTVKATSADPITDATTAGVHWGREIAAEHPATSTITDIEGCHDRAVAILDQVGFAPEVTDRGEGSRTVRLTRCPLLQAAREHPDVVCAVHRGLIQGSLPQPLCDRVDVDLIPFAEPGACLLHLRQEGR